ncbi:limkain-b1-type NYN domain-containing protein, partial [Mycena sp. CBHHK59/15]
LIWYIENCHAVSNISGYETASGIRNVAHRFGSVKSFKAYMELPETDTLQSLSLRSELQSSGISLTDCPHNGRKNVADHMIIVDMMAYAMDHPAPATLILISGNRDFAYAVSTLRLRRYHIVVISLPVPGAHISLKKQASLCLDW